MFENNEERRNEAAQKKAELIDNLSYVISAMETDQETGEKEGLYDPPEEGEREDIKGLKELLAMLSTPTSVLVVVDHGCVTGMWSNDPTLGFDILDFDGIDEEETEKEREDHNTRIIREAGDRNFIIY